MAQDNYTPNMRSNRVSVGASGSFESVQTAVGMSAARAVAWPDKSGTVAFTDDIPGVGASLDAGGLGLTPQGCCLSSAGAPAAPGTNVAQYDHRVIPILASITTADPGGTLELRRNGVAVMAFDATILGFTPPNVPTATLLGALGDVYTVAAAGGAGLAVGVVTFAQAPIP